NDREWGKVLQRSRFVILHLLVDSALLLVESTNKKKTFFFCFIKKKTLTLHPLTKNKFSVKISF
ncbi:hypothetical protein, partial [Prevotella amnii]|uniref:hypothetical protein n=1 Tax=Prevotella amnii TaxID=419005 RepID=UPI00056AA205